ncbi:MAG: hypothetical protein WB777_03060, partial [Mycobacterium sp.]
FLGYPDSAAARGEVGSENPALSKSAAEQPSSRQPRRPARAAVARVRLPGPVKRAARLLPGVHW